MKKLFYFAAAATMMTMAACSNEDSVLDQYAGNEVAKGTTVNLTLQATRGEADTRTAISMNDEYHSLESAWESTDKIYVYSLQSGTQLGTLFVEGDVINQKTSDAAQYSTSYATFKGSVTVPANEVKLAFVYQGKDRSLTPTDGLLTYEMGTVSDVAGLAKWDVAYATGELQIDGTDAYVAASFANKIGFGYFTTAAVASETAVKVNYNSSFTLDVKSGTITAVAGQVEVPGNAEFYMPLMVGTVAMQGDPAWETKDSKLGKSAVVQKQSFSAAAGNYYRQGKAGNYGPVPFVKTEWENYETLKNSTFAVSATKNVHFTQGNLQWISTDATDASKGYWKIADSQYSYLGTANAKPTTAEAGTKLPAGSVDLFGWGEVTAPFNGSNQNGDYQSSISTANVDLTTDWATKFNSGTELWADVEEGQAYPANGGDYCVLTKDEWQYLFANQYWGFATVNLTNGGTVNGIVVCPSGVDENTAKSYLTGTVYKSSAVQTFKTAAYIENIISQETIDDNGLLFLPAAGSRSGTSISNVGSRGHYWSTTSSSATGAYRVYFRTTGFRSAHSDSRYLGFSVRLASVAE